MSHTAGFNIFSIVQPNEGLDGTSPTKPSFGFTSTNFTLWSSQIMFYSQCHTIRRLGWASASQGLFWHDSDDKDQVLFLCDMRAYCAYYEERGIIHYKCAGLVLIFCKAHEFMLTCILCYTKKHSRFQLT